MFAFNTYYGELKSSYKHYFVLILRIIQNCLAQGVGIKLWILVSEYWK